MINIKIGDKFGKLTVERFADKKHYFACVCECEERTIVYGSHLRCGDTKSCGCLRGKYHGMKNSPEYKSWADMIQRTTNPKCSKWDGYAGRGITVCQRWRKFENFFKDMGKKPSAHYTLERKNNDGNYEPSNCKWATMKEQNRNSSHNHILEFGGKKQCMTAWAEEKGINSHTLFGRLKRGWSVRRALTEKVHSSVPT